MIHDSGNYKESNIKHKNNEPQMNVPLIFQIMLTAIIMILIELKILLS